MSEAPLYTSAAFEAVEVFTGANVLCDVNSAPRDSHFGKLQGYLTYKKAHPPETLP